MGASVASSGPWLPTASFKTFAVAFVTAPASTSRKGPYGAPSFSRLRPVKTSQPLAAASVATSDASRDVPMPAAPGLAGDARRNVDRGAEDVTGLLHHLARVEADADPELALGVLLAVVGDRMLDVERALDAVTRRAEADHEAVAEALDPAPGVLGDLLVDDRLVRPHDLVRGGEASRRQEACRLLDVGEHDGDRALRLADRKAADDRFRGQRRRGVDRLPHPLRDLTQQALRRAEARFALPVPDGLEQSGLGREAKLAPGRILADLALRRVVARPQLGAFERFRERRREAQAEAASGDDAFDHGLDSSRRAGGARGTPRRGGGRGHAPEAAGRRRPRTRRSRGAGQRG